MKFLEKAKLRRQKADPTSDCLGPNVGVDVPREAESDGNVLKRDGSAQFTKL